MVIDQNEGTFKEVKVDQLFISRDFLYKKIGENVAIGIGFAASNWFGDTANVTILEEDDGNKGQ